MTRKTSWCTAKRALETQTRHGRPRFLGFSKHGASCRPQGKCDQLADVDPQVVAKNLAIYSNSVRSYGRYDAKIVYIAAPPSELELILKVSPVPISVL